MTAPSTLDAGGHLVPSAAGDYTPEEYAEAERFVARERHDSRVDRLIAELRGGVAQAVGGESSNVAAGEPAPEWHEVIHDFTPAEHAEATLRVLRAREQSRIRKLVYAIDSGALALAGECEVGISSSDVAPDLGDVRRDSGDFLVDRSLVAALAAARVKELEARLAAIRAGGVA